MYIKCKHHKQMISFWNNQYHFQYLFRQGTIIRDQNLVFLNIHFFNHFFHASISNLYSKICVLLLPTKRYKSVIKFQSNAWKTKVFLLMCRIILYIQLWNRSVSTIDLHVSTITIYFPFYSSNVFLSSEFGFLRKAYVS